VSNSALIQAQRIQCPSVTSNTITKSAQEEVKYISYRI